MHLPSHSLLVLILTATSQAASTPPSSSAILLSNVKTLTLRANLKTSHNRVPAIPQLNCVGGPACSLYTIDVLRCKNQGADYDAENIQWTCTASLPEEFKLGVTDVICEGFASLEDPYVLKGSCGVEYRLLLTEKGEEKFGKGGGNVFSGYKGKNHIEWPALIFWALFVAVVGWMIYSAFIRPRLIGRPGQNGGNGFPWGGGGGGGWFPDNDDPPPPYTPSAPKTSNSRPPAPAQEGWRPGFWTGTLGGAAAGYMAGARQSQTRNNNQGWGNRGGGGVFRNDNGEGSSWGGGGRPSASSSSSFSSTRHESSGFGGTGRR